MIARWRARTACLVLSWLVAVACQDSFSGPNDRGMPGRPLFHHTNPPHYQDCRMFASGATLINQGGWWEGQCSVTVTGNPAIHMTNPKPDTITFTFSSPVTDIHVTPLLGPDDPCSTTLMTWTAYDLLGAEVASGAWVPPCQGGSAGFFIAEAVKRIRLTAPIPMGPNQFSGGHAILFFMDFYVPCPPTGDPALDDPNVRQGLRDERASSRPNPDGSGRKERRGFLFQRDDGSYFLEHLDDPSATMCETGIQGLPAIPSIPGATFIGEYHTHPSNHLEPVTGCRGQKPGESRKAIRNAKTGGGSDGDWEYANVRQKSMYVIDNKLEVSRLDPNTLDRRNNPNRWKYDKDCIVRR
jgi:hypothetical protein